MRVHRDTALVVLSEDSIFKRSGKAYVKSVSLHANHIALA